MSFEIKFATIEEVPLILAFVRELAIYEKLAHEVIATEDMIRESLFGDNAKAEAIIGYLDKIPVSFAVFFHNFSTFVGRPGIYLEDLYVKENARHQGLGEKMLSFIAKLAKSRQCKRLEWSVLNWNKSAIQFYKKMGAKPMEEWTVYRLSGKELDRFSEYFDNENDILQT